MLSSTAEHKDMTFPESASTELQLRTAVALCLKKKKTHNAIAFFNKNRLFFKCSYSFPAFFMTIFSETPKELIGKIVIKWLESCFSKGAQ